MPIFHLAAFFSAFVSPAIAKDLGIAPSRCVVGARVPFVDEAARKPKFDKVRRELLGIVQKRDLTRLMPYVAKDIRFSLGPDGEGKKNFLRYWKLEGAESAKSEFWTELEAGLRRGGNWDAKDFSFPYVGKSWPESCSEYGAFAAVVAGGVPLRERASNGATVVKTLADEIVHLPEGMSPEPWVKVQTHGETVGFVDRQKLVSPIGYRGRLKPNGKRWELTVFLSGD